MKELVMWALLQAAPAQATLPPAQPAEAVATEATVGTTQSVSGRWHIKVLASSDKLKRGPQRFTVRVTDSATGKPMSKGTLHVEPWMPSMGHGISETPRVTPQGEGLFEVTDLDLFMPGTWELRFTLEGPTQDTAKVTLKLGR
ncbi:FixH family protein [Myxococcus faecalis]|uniref:FixH family protein n=1 Tax=Myxococcus faecalis TaxID=3115646 RepID=UPI003CF251FD